MKQRANTYRGFLRAALLALVMCLACMLVPGCNAATPAQNTSGSSAVQAPTSGEVQSDSIAASTKSASSGSTAQGQASQREQTSNEMGGALDEDGSYTSKDEVALYLHTYGHLPSNFISKSAAKKQGWVSSKGNLDEVCPGKSIGGSQFYNDEGILPDKQGRTWKECDIGYEGGFRGPERIVFSNDGLIYYTADHYKTFEQLY